MDYVTVRELRSESGKVWERVDAGEEIVITRNGKPIALLLHTKPAEVEAAVRAYRAARLGLVLDRIQAHAVQGGTHDLSEAEIEAEITAVRRNRASRVKPAVANAKPRRR